MTLIQDCALTFQSLLKLRFRYTFRAKDREICLDIIFRKNHFRHLTGVEKLGDIKLPAKAEMLYRDALSGKISDEYLKNSSHYSKHHISGRLECIKHLNCFLRNVQHIYIFNSKTFERFYGNASLINADYLFKFDADYANNNLKSLYFYFIRNTGDPGDPDAHCSVSTFESHGFDYTQNQKRYTILTKDVLTMD